MPFFFIFYFTDWYRIEKNTFNKQEFAWGLHGGVDVKWSGGLLVLELHCCDCGQGLIQQRNCDLLPNGDRQCGH